MTRTIEFKNHPVDGVEKRFIETLIEGIEDNFKQRKQYDEYYFTPYESHINEFIIDSLSSNYIIDMTYCTLIIHN
ncbi:MAG: hypothetical protein GY928_21470 [Colwellia sp.]|nr:hypothetical protein [Colwellia sp.]